MAIYSLSISSINRATQAKPGTAGAHVRYIGRRGAVAAVTGRGVGLSDEAALDEIMGRAPRARPEAEAVAGWLDDLEPTMRKNARVVTKLRIGLLAGLSLARNVALIDEYMDEVTRSRAPWAAWIHHPSSEGDQRNIHAHVIIRDRDPQTGKTIAGMSDSDCAERVREAWERHCNDALAQAGHDVRVDRRSLATRALAADAPRPPRPVHRGPAVTAMERRGERTLVGEFADAVQEVRDLMAERAGLALKIDAATDVPAGDIETDRVIGLSMGVAETAVPSITGLRDLRETALDRPSNSQEEDVDVECGRDGGRVQGRHAARPLLRAAGACTRDDAGPTVDGGSRSGGREPPHDPHRQSRRRTSWWSS